MIEEDDRGDGHVSSRALDMDDFTLTAHG
jgi:hypothetical protein